jgi:Fe-S-cluster containining protein
MKKKQVTNKKKKSVVAQSGHESCEKCGSLCCRNLAMIIGRPKSKKELQDLKWQLHFDTVRVYISGKKWYLMVDGKCRYLGLNNRCKCYDVRPAVCRKHNPPHCEYYGRFYDVMLQTPEELEAYYHPKYYPTK